MLIFPAEEEFTLLLLEANLIAEIDNQQKNANPKQIISSYYGLLEKGVAARINVHRQKLISLTPRYEVAYKAADSAELAELMDEISFHWQTIKGIHSRHFTSSVQVLLSNAYDQEFLDRLTTP